MTGALSSTVAGAAAVSADVPPTPPAKRPRGAGLLAVMLVLGGSAGSAGLAAVANWVTANGLGPAQFGLFSLAMAVMTVLLEVGGPAIDTAIVRFAGPLVARQPERAEAYFRAGLRLKLAVSGSLMLLLMATADVIATQVFHDASLASIIRWLSLCLLAGNLSTISLARLQSAERFVAHSGLRILTNALKVALVGAALWFGFLTPQSAAIAWALSFVLAYLAGLALCGFRQVPARPLPQDEPGRDIFRFARWTMLSGLLFAIHIRSDMLLLGRFGSAEDVGVYSVAWNLMLLIDLITSSLVIALMPMAAKASTPAALKRLRRRTLLIASGVAVVLLPMNLFAPELIHALFPAYPQAVAPFRLLFWSSIVMLMVYPLYLGFYAQNRAGKVTLAYGVLCVASLVVGLAIIPSHGAMGAAATTLIARLVGAAAILLLLALELRKPAAD